MRLSRRNTFGSLGRNRTFASPGSLLFVTFIFVFAFGSQCKKQTPPAAAGPTFLAVSDIHFNPFDRATPELIARLSAAEPAAWATKFQSEQFPAAGEDTNYALLKSFLAYAGDPGRVPAPEFIIISGDFLAHKFIEQFRAACRQARCTGDYKDFIEKTFQFLALELTNTFPGVQIFAALGNNDAFCGDYWVQPNSDFLKRMLPIWQKLSGLDTDFDTINFVKGGYFITPHPTLSGHQIIVLNDVYFSGKYQDPRYLHTCKAGDRLKAGKDQIAWLTKILAREAAKSMLVYHIPPGMDAYGDRPMMNDELESPFIKQNHWYHNTDHDIVLSFAGHTHFDDFRLLNADARRPYGLVHLTPSITVSHKNYSAFQSFVYDKNTGAIQNFTTYSRPTGDAGVWQRLYDYNSTFGQNGYNYKAHWKVTQEILQFEGQAFENYEKYLTAGSPDAPHKIGAIHYACATVHFNPDDYKQCVKRGAAKSK